MNKFKQITPEIFMEAIENSPASIVITDTDNNILYANNYFSQLTGYTLDEVVGQNPRILNSGLTQPATYEDMWNKLHDHGLWEGIFINRKKDNTIYYERARISLIKDKDNTVTHHVAIKENITDLRMAETALHHSNQRFKKLSETTFEAIVFVESDIITDFNQQANTLFNYPPEKMYHNPINSIIYHDDLEYFQKKMNDKLFHTFDIRMVKSSGEMIYAEVKSFVSEKKEAEEHVFVIRDITERKAMEQQLHDANKRLKMAAEIDYLTHLYNRRYFMSFLEREIASVQRYHNPLTILMVDIDLFKKINDTLGHLVGDEALIQLSDIIKKTVRDADISSRYGGEEFCILLRNTTLEHGLMFAERLRKNVEHFNFSSNDGTIFNMTCSIGVAEYKEGDLTPEEVMKLADDKLYKAKENGRNRVES